MNSAVKNALLYTEVGQKMLSPLRFKRAITYYLPALGRIASWSLKSRELANFTYDLTETNIQYLLHTLAAILNRELSEVSEIADEALTDFRALKIGRRLGWYLFARLLKPELIIETGVDKGLGSRVLCSAILRNGSGRYLGTDINPRAGELLTKPYSSVGRIAYGDSIMTLSGCSDPIGLFINDSDHSSAYEAREYEIIRPLLTPNAIILGDNAHCNDELMKFSERYGRRFLFFKEQPKDHWYPGAGIGISYL